MFEEISWIYEFQTSIAILFALDPVSQICNHELVENGGGEGYDMNMSVGEGNVLCVPKNKGNHLPFDVSVHLFVWAVLLKWIRSLWLTEY